MRQEHLAGGNEKGAVAQRLQHRRPAVPVAGNAVEPQVVDVGVGVKLGGVVDLKNVHLAEDVFFGSPIGGVVQQVEHAPAEARPGEVGRHGFPRAAEVVV